MIIELLGCRASGRGGRLLLGGFARSGRGRVGADADFHGGVAGEDDVAAARDEVDVDRAAGAERSHGHAEWLRMNGESERDADQLVSARASGGAFGRVAESVAAEAERQSGERGNDSRGDVARVGNSGLRAAFGIKPQIFGFAG